MIFFANDAGSAMRMNSLGQNILRSGSPRLNIPHRIVALFTLSE